MWFNDDDAWSASGAWRRWNGHRRGRSIVRSLRLSADMRVVSESETGMRIRVDDEDDLWTLSKVCTGGRSGDVDPQT